MNHRAPTAPPARAALVRTTGAFAWLGASSLLLLLAAAAVRADDAAPPPPATPVVEKLHDAVVESMKNADALGFRGRYDKLEPVLRSTFDFDFMAEKAVGRHWRHLDAAEQERMRDVFARFTLSTYASRFSGWSGEHFETRSETAAPRDTVFVRTRLVRTDGEKPIEINYRLHRTDEGWRIIDVLLRGTVSELALRRSEYSSVIKRDGFDALIEDLEEKIAELAAGEGDAAEPY